MLEIKARMHEIEYLQNLLITYQILTVDGEDRLMMKTMIGAGPSFDRLFYRIFRDRRDWQLARAESLSG